MKKTLAVLAALMVFVFAGSALAYGGRHHGGGMGYGMGPKGGWYRPGPDGRGEGPAGWNIEIPQNIRDKQTESQKIMIDLRAEMSKPTINRARALELYRKHRDLRNEISDWFFTQRLDYMIKQPAPQSK